MKAAFFHKAFHLNLSTKTNHTMTYLIGSLAMMLKVTCSHSAQLSQRNRPIYCLCYSNIQKC